MKSCTFLFVFLINFVIISARYEFLRFGRSENSKDGNPTAKISLMEMLEDSVPLMRRNGQAASLMRRNGQEASFSVPLMRQSGPEASLMRQSGQEAPFSVPLMRRSGQAAALFHAKTFAKFCHFCKCCIVLN